MERANARIGGLFRRSEPRARSWGYLQGLLSGCERKNGWQMAERMGDAAPYGMQHLLDRACWDADQARDRLRSYVLDEIGGPNGVLIVDETGFLKKERHSAGGKRQYSVSTSWTGLSGEDDTSSRQNSATAENENPLVITLIYNSSVSEMATRFIQRNS